MRKGPLIALSGVLLAPFVAIAATDFERDIQPIFEQRCYACHSAAAAQGQFRLDSREHAFRGGGSGVPPIVPGDSAGSLS